jgi:monoamine oxidase
VPPSLSRQISYTPALPDARSRLLAGLEMAAIVIKDWGAEEWTGGCYAAHFPVGGWTSYGGAVREPCGRIHWAGTETASEWHGYMEGALRSGDRAASEILRSIGSG